MRFLPTRIHGVIDYLWSVALIAAPWLFGFATSGAKQWVAVALGVGGILYALLTDYELGVLPVLSMPMHLVIDGLGGVLLAASPWLFGFAGTVYGPHLAFGIFAIGASLVTKTTPEGAPVSR